jgi:hypothetical protein
VQGSWYLRYLYVTPYVSGVYVQCYIVRSMLLKSDGCFVTVKNVDTRYQIYFFNRCGTVSMPL